MKERHGYMNDSTVKAPTFEVQPHRRFRDSTEYTVLVMPHTADNDRSSVIGWVGESRRGGLVEVASMLNRIVNMGDGFESGIYTAVMPTMSTPPRGSQGTTRRTETTC